jgi:hypothetical protein
VDVVDSSNIHLAPGLSLKCEQELPHQLGVTVDGENLSLISQIEAGQADFTEYLPGALAYHLSRTPKVLIIKPQGSLEILTALHHQSSSVVAVISNPLVGEAIERYGKESRLLDDPRLKIAIEGFSNYIRRSHEEFDVIQLPLTDSFKVVAVGAYSLSEDYRYTTEAFEDYYRHVATGGFLCVTRWIQVPPSEETRPISLATAILENLNVSYPEQHVAAIRSLQTNAISKREPLQSAGYRCNQGFLRKARI